MDRATDNLFNHHQDPNVNPAHTAICMDGKKVLAAVKHELIESVAQLKAHSITPSLYVLLVGEDPGSKIYVRAKQKDCLEVGIDAHIVKLDAKSTTRDVLEVIDALNSNPSCLAYIVQLPLPEHIDKDAVLLAIDPKKDADALHPLNIGSYILSSNLNQNLLPCTPLACIELMTRYGINLKGANVCVVGRGITVGKHLPGILGSSAYNSTVTVTHTGTKDIKSFSQNADVIIAACGSPNLIQRDWVKPGACVLDVGVSRVMTDSGSKIIGDVDVSVREVAGFISPNPGGVGPVTRAMLLKNAIKIAMQKI